MIHHPWFHGRPDLLPSLTAALGAGMWGLFWIPVRSIEGAGISTGWTPPLMFVFGVVILLPFAARHWRFLLIAGRQFWTACALAGIAFTLYAASFNLTDVVRVTLLFYVAPVWSTILGILFLGERLTVNRVLAIVMGLGGLAIVLGGDSGIPLPRNLGDWLALASGVSWSLASMGFFQGGSGHFIEKTFGFALCTLIAAVALAVLPLGIDAAIPDTAAIGRAWIWLAVVAVFMAPALYMIVWPASVLSPGRVAILFMTEALTTVVSASLLTDEPFGVREAVGALLIVGAGVVEVVRPGLMVARLKRKKAEG